MQAARDFVSDMAEHLSMPAVYVEIRKLLLNSSTTIDDFVAVVERDSMLAVRVMRMAKSSYFGFPRGCENLYQAISLIGLMQLHDLMLGSLCMRAFSAIPPEVLNLRAFWRYNVQCGIAARTIGQYTESETHHVFFTLGLLHEIGHAAMFLKAPEESAEALDDSLSRLRSLADSERDTLGFDYGQAGAELMRLWHLPPVYPQVAAFHLDPESCAPEFRTAVDVVHLAHRYCQDADAGGSRRPLGEAGDSCVSFTNLPQNIDALVAGELDAHTDAVLGLLWPCGAQPLYVVESGKP